MVYGWEAVRQSLEQIFASTRWMRVTPTRGRVEIIGDVAVVTCTENITAKSDEDVGLAVAQATNLFRGPRRAGASSITTPRPLPST